MRSSTIAGWLLATLVGASGAQDRVGPEVEDPVAGIEGATDEPLPADAGTDPFAMDRYRLDSIVCPFKGDIDYDPGDIDCFLLEVPENRENPLSRMIELHVVRLNARAGRDTDEDDEPDEELARYAEGLAEGRREDPVVYLTGGPGAHAAYYIGRFMDHTLLDHRDLYILEQRGIGFSGDFCPFYDIRDPAGDNATTFEESQEVGLRNLSDCVLNARAAGVDLSGYHTIENARDVKALRRALGFEQWNVWGISYGSILGQAYLKEDPEAIRAVALDAIMPLEIRGSEEYWRVVKWFVRDLEKIQAVCDAQPKCAERYPDIAGRIRAAMRSVQEAPIVVEAKDIEVYPGGEVHIFHDLIAALPFSMFYEQSNYPALPGVIYAWADAVERRDETLFKALAAAAAQGGGGPGISSGMAQAVFCLDGDSQMQAAAGKRDLEEYPVLGEALGNAESLDRGAAICGELGLDPRPAEQYRAVRTAVPALLIEGDMDPITPPPNARAILPGFENGTYVEFAYAGHGPSRSVECAGHLLNKFYDDPGGEPDLSCAKDMEAPEIWAPFYTTSLAPELLLRAVNDPRDLAVPGAWLGASVLILLIAFPVLTFGPVIRFMEGRKASRAGPARFMAWLTATVSVAGLGVMAAAGGVTAQTGELILLFGLVPWAVWGGWLILAGAVVGLLAVIAAIRARSVHFLPVSALCGFLLTALAAVGLAAFAVTWGIGPL